MIFDEQYKSSSLCNILHPPLISTQVQVMFLAFCFLAFSPVFERFKNSSYASTPTAVLGYFNNIVVYNFNKRNIKTP